MSDIKSWANAAVSNSAAPPNGFPEGMAFSAVNDAAREVMASIRRWYENAQWQDLGHVPTFVSATSFSVPGDQTAFYTIGRRLKLSDASTLYGAVASANFASSVTTITVTLDSGSLSVSLTAVAVGILSLSNPAFPVIPVAQGGTGAATAAAARTNLGAAASTDIVPPPTGAVQQFIGTSAPSGWLMLNGDTVGNTGSGAVQANSANQALFTLLWNSMADAQAPVSGGRGASAAADWSFGKTIALPDARGRAIIGTGTGATLTARTHGDHGGEETHQLTIPEIPAHTHAAPASSGATASGPGGAGNTVTSSNITGSTGNDGAHNNMQPWLALNYIVKI